MSFRNFGTIGNAARFTNTEALPLGSIRQIWSRSVTYRLMPSWVSPFGSFRPDANGWMRAIRLHPDDAAVAVLRELANLGDVDLAARPDQHRLRIDEALDDPLGRAMDDRDHSREQQRRERAGAERPLASRPAHHFSAASAAS